MSDQKVALYTHKDDKFKEIRFYHDNYPWNPFEDHDHLGKFETVRADSSYIGSDYEIASDDVHANKDSLHKTLIDLDPVFIFNYYFSEYGGSDPVRFSIDDTPFRISHLATRDVPEDEDGMEYELKEGEYWYKDKLIEWDMEGGDHVGYFYVTEKDLESWIGKNWYEDIKETEKRVVALVKGFVQGVNQYANGEIYVAERYDGLHPENTIWINDLYTIEDAWYYFGENKEDYEENFCHV